MFKCDRCGKNIKRKNNFIRHLQRKNICKPIISTITPEELLQKYNFKKIIKKFQCDYCKKKFSRKNNLRYHQKKSCKANKINNTQIICHNNNNDNNNKTGNIPQNIPNDNHWKELFEKSEQQKEKLIQQEKQEKMELINLFRKEKQDFMNQIELLLTKVGNNNVTNIQQNNIIIRNFGEEDISYLTENYFKKLFSSQTPINTIPTIVKKIYFNYEHPENMNLKIENTNLPYINVYKEDKWQQQDKKDTIHKIVNKNFNLIDTKFTEVKEALPKQKKESYTEYKQGILEKSSKKSKQYIKDIIKKTENIILVSS